MIAIIKYYDKGLGSQISVRAGSPSDIVYWMLYKDNAENFDGLDDIKNKFSSSSLTEEDIKTLSCKTETGSVECLGYSVNDKDKEALIKQILLISEKKRKIFDFREKIIQDLIIAIKNDDYGHICSVHHID